MFVEFKENFQIKSSTSFKIGGQIEKLYFPQTEQEFIFLLKTLNTPLVMGNWSNVLVSSQGISGNVISTSKLAKINVEGTKITADCGVKGPKIAQVATENGLTGFEFMSGFPGSIGGNIYMNASAHSQAISDFLLDIRVFDMSKKEILLIDRKTLDFAYRSSILQKKPYVLLTADFELKENDKVQIESFVHKILSFRKAYQPSLATPNCGSVFRNPEDQSAGKLLENVGAKKFKVGGAKVFEKHANFIINTGDATSTDVLELMFKMYMAVWDKYSIKLQPEVRFVGIKSKREDEICNIMYNQR